MRSYRGARQLTGRATARGMTDERGFRAGFNGHCRGCGGPYRAGDRIKSPGKGMGAYHLGCKMFIDRKPASDEREAQRIEVRESIRSWNTTR